MGRATCRLKAAPAQKVGLAVQGRASCAASSAEAEVGVRPPAAAGLLVLRQHHRALPGPVAAAAAPASGPTGHSWCGLNQVRSCVRWDGTLGPALSPGFPARSDVVAAAAAAAATTTAAATHSSRGASSGHCGGASGRCAARGGAGQVLEEAVGAEGFGARYHLAGLDVRGASMEGPHQADHQPQVLELELPGRNGSGVPQLGAALEKAAPKAGRAGRHRGDHVVQVADRGTSQELVHHRRHAVQQQRSQEPLRLSDNGVHAGVAGLCPSASARPKACPRDLVSSTASQAPGRPCFSKGGITTTSVGKLGKFTLSGLPAISR